MILNNKFVRDENGEVIYITNKGYNTPIALTYDMIYVSGITPSMVYQLVHGEGIYIGEDKWVRV